MEALLIRYGYILLFLGVAIEGEAFLITAAFLAHRGILNLPSVILVAVASNWTADQVYYVLARGRGRRWLQTRFGQHPRYPRVMEAISRHSGWLLLASRFAFGFRVIIPAACGAVGMPPLRFAIINLLAGTIWAVPTALLGFYLGGFAGDLLAEFRRYELLVFLVIVAPALLLLIRRRLRRSPWLGDLGLQDLHLLVPLVIGLMGAANILTALWPRSQATLRALEIWLPLEVMQQSRALMLFAGLALLQVTRSLIRRKELGWYVAVTALSVSLLLHVTHGIDLHHSLVAGLLLAYLVVFRRRFYAASDPPSIRIALVMAPLVAAVVMAYGYFGLHHLEGQFGRTDTSGLLQEAFRAGILAVDPGLEPRTPRAAAFLYSLQTAGWLARLYLLVLVLRPVILRNRQEAPAEKMREIFAAHGRHSLSAFAVQHDKHHQLLAGGRALVAYATRGSIALTCGDPLAADGDFDHAVREFLETCRGHGWTPCFYETAEERLPVYHTLGLRSFKIAEEALLDLKEFSLAGGKRANLRAMVNKVMKTGMVVRRYDRQANPDPGLDEQLEAISEEWLAEKRLAEMGFTIGRFSLEAVSGIPLFLAESAGRVEAFCSWLPYRNGEAAVLDLMRKRSTAVSGTMDLLIARSLQELGAAGLAEASLANAPLANVSQPKGPLDRGVALMFEHLNSFYGYKNLFQFKKKFAPRWEGRHVVYPGGANLPKVVYAMTGVHSSGGLLQLLLRR